MVLEFIASENQKGLLRHIYTSIHILSISLSFFFLFFFFSIIAIVSDSYTLDELGRSFTLSGYKIQGYFIYAYHILWISML